jgi:MFS family permease
VEGYRLAFWQLLVLVFLSSFFNNPGTSARTALLPEVVHLSGLPLERANAFFQTIQNASRLIGAPLAGVLIAFLSPSTLLWIDAATFIVSAGIIGLTIPSRQIQIEVVNASEHFQIQKNSYLSQMKEGFAFIRADRLLLTLVLTIMITNFIESPFLTVLIPVYMQMLFRNSVDFGLTVAAFGAGAVGGSFVYGVISHFLPRRATYICSFILFGLPIWVLALFPPFPIVLLLIVLMGIASGPINPILYTIYQERAPEGIRGRVIGIITAGAYLAIPLGAILVGYLLDVIGIRITLIAQAASYLLVTLSLLVNPTLYRMNKSKAS